MVWRTTFRLPPITVPGGASSVAPGGALKPAKPVFGRLPPTTTGAAEVDLVVAVTLVLELGVEGVGEAPE